MRAYLPKKDVAIFLDLLPDTYNEWYNLQELTHCLINASTLCTFSQTGETMTEQKLYRCNLFCDCGGEGTRGIRPCKTFQVTAQLASSSSLAPGSTLRSRSSESDDKHDELVKVIPLSVDENTTEAASSLESTRGSNSSAVDSFSYTEVLAVIAKLRKAEIRLHPYTEPPALPLSTPLNSGTTSKPPQQPIEEEAKEDDLHSLR